MHIKKVKAVFNGNPSQNYGVSLVMWDHTRHNRTHPALTPANEGWYSIYLEGWKADLT